MKNKIFLTVPLLSIALFACSDNSLTAKELSGLSKENFATKACEEIVAANFEQLKVILDDKHFNKLQKKYEKNSDSWSQLSEKMTCTIKTVKELKGKTKFYFEQGAFSLVIKEINDLYLVVDID
ncbi:hypothetical protein [Colwellia psychrerythraea]|uniref:Putative lipoprotein n=1 Tax=Colwellia psychrerythraea (strain 34H / ATCC BAA-681) TaxID=167879 RepID=Q484J2_COLP3|nr:hypothetical protein [Colwellia psychrerythraea]AAZ28626.1 putative lipoprotein [Colwellia psychrerythraea 34H]